MNRGTEVVHVSLLFSNELTLQFLDLFKKNLCLCTYMYVCMCVYVFRYVCAYIYARIMCIYMCVLTYVNMNICMFCVSTHVCLFTLGQRPTLCSSGPSTLFFERCSLIGLGLAD